MDEREDDEYKTILKRIGGIEKEKPLKELERSVFGNDQKDHHISRLPFWALSPS